MLQVLGIAIRSWKWTDQQCLHLLHAFYTTSSKQVNAWL